MSKARAFSLHSSFIIQDLYEAHFLLLLLYMNLLVTGGAGFIGSNFVLRHVEQHPDDTVIVLDKLTYAGDTSFLSPVIQRIRFIQGDIADADLMLKALERYAVDTIVNFAAETHVDRSIQNAIPFLHTNVLGVWSLIEICKRRPDVRLLHISTDEVFGDIADDERPRTSGDALYPGNPYSATKASAEMLLLAAMRTHKLHTAISRCTNNYGPHQASEKFLPTVIRNALKHEPIPVYGKGENKRDWLYVTDHCDALEIILKTDWAFWDDQVAGVHESQPKGSGHTFQISANDERRNIDVARAVLKILGKPESLLTFVPDRPGHDWRYALDSSAIRHLGWKPHVLFDEGLQRTIEWYRRKII